MLMNIFLENANKDFHFNQTDIVTLIKRLDQENPDRILVFEKYFKDTSFTHFTFNLHLTASSVHNFV